MQKSLDYINGVIAAKEVNLLGDKISKLCDMTAEDAFRAVSERSEERRVGKECL